MLYRRIDRMAWREWDETPGAITGGWEQAGDGDYIGFEDTATTAACVLVPDEQSTRDAALGAAVRDALIECSCDNPRILRNLLSGPDVEYILDAIAAALRSPDASAGEAERDD